MSRSRSRKDRGNRKRPRKEALSFLDTVRKRSHERTNRRLNSREGKSMWASVAMDDRYDEADGVGFFTHLLRFFCAISLLPLSWITTWAFFSQFSHATLERGFWQSAQFWYFTIGALLMAGWFWSKLGQSFFLYLYVFGHELTHAVFVKCFGGKILEMEWSAEGGYVTTDKTNWVIALSPYFVPFWTMIAVIGYVAAGLFLEISPVGDLVFYGVVGASWTFHLAWTLWMIPKDQPDLQDNGTFLSLVLIYFGNLLVLVSLVCLASPSPLGSAREFAGLWIETAESWSRVVSLWLAELYERVPR